MNRSLIIAVSLVAVTGLHAAAHGVQVQLSFDVASGKIQTRQIVHSGGASEPVPGFASGNSLAPQARVFAVPVLKTVVSGQNLWYTRPTDLRSAQNIPVHPTGPGLTYRFDYQTGSAGFGWEWGNTTNPAANASLPNLAGTAFTYQLLDGLKKWDGSSFIDAGAVQLQLHRGDGTTIPNPLVQATTSDSGPFAALALSAVSAINKPGATSTSTPHSSVTYRLLGDGVNPNVEAPDGVYLLSLKVLSSAINPANGQSIESDPFYYVLSKDASYSDAIAASEAIARSSGAGNSQIQVLVPEPGTLALLGVAALAGLSRRRA